MVTVNRPRTAVAAPRRSEEDRPTLAAALMGTAVSAEAVPCLRHFVHDTATRWTLPAETIDALSLVVTELVTNVVLHSGSPDVTVLITHNGAAVHVAVRDAGTWRTRTSPRLAPEDGDATCGRGLDMVEYCCDWWLVHLSPIGTRVVVCLPIAATAG